MFEIPDDDLLWNDDFSLDEIQTGEISISDGENRSLKLGFPERDIKRSKPDKELYKQPTSTFSNEAVLQGRCRDPLEQKSSSSIEGQAETSKLDSKHCSTSDKHDASTEQLAKGYKRKFPGPAGILPPYSPAAEGVALTSILDEASKMGSPATADLKNMPHNSPWSQGQASDVFSSPQWKTLVSDLGQDAESLLSKFSIRCMLQKATRNLLLRRKIPLIIGVLDSLDMQGSNANIVIRDPSGKITGALHQDLFKDPLTALQAGTVLVLRQVSVMSPSSRTHYLNVTPENVALIYTSNKDSLVSQQSWTSHSVIKLDDKHTDVHPIQQIVHDSEQELAACSEKLHRVVERRHHQSLSNPMGLKTPAAHSRLNESALCSHPVANSASRYPLSVRTPNRVSPIRSELSTQGSLFSLHHQTLTHFPRGFSANKGTSDLSSNLTGNFQQQPNCNKSVTQQNYILHGSRAVRNIPNMADKRISASSTRHKQLQGDTEVHHFTASGMGGGKKFCDIKVASNDFPDDDHMILQMCDDILDKTLSESSNRLMIQENCYKREISKEDGVTKSGSKSSNIIDQVFQDCRQENDRICSSFRISNPDLSNARIAETEQNHFISRADMPHNFVSPPNTLNNKKKFTFKRSIHSPATSAVPNMHPVCDSYNQHNPSYVRTIHRDEPYLSTRNSISYTENAENNFTVNCRATITDHSSNPALSSALVAEDVAMTINNRTALHGDPALPISHHSANICMPADQKADSISAISMSSKDSERDLRIRLGKRNFESVEGTKATEITKIFPQWDDDMNDDLLLSQLSDEF